MSCEWWKKNVIYHIYLPSFKDSNGDGIGDLQGLISKLDYFKELNVSTILLSPFYPSPMKDNGYDITSFIDVDPMFGTMEDFELLISEMNSRDMNILIDFVPNHTSDQHPWFDKSVEKEEPYTDFYVWVDGIPGPENKLRPPNNWVLSVFGGSAWTWNDKRKQFYYHQFLPEQPDLNYRNETVKKEMKDVLHFWLDKNVDGFRIDSASHLFEDSRFLDEPLAEESTAKSDEYGYLDHIYTKGQSDTVKLLEVWRQVLDVYSNVLKKPKIMLIEGMEDVNNVVSYYGTTRKKLAEIPMNFQLLKVTSSSTGRDLEEIIDEWIENMPLGKYPNHVLSSHDLPRVVSRVGRTLASSLHMVMMLLPGIPIWYYGDEIGMNNGDIGPEDIKDSFALRTKPSNSRDPMRTPMCWNGGKQAGFTESEKSWLPLNSDYEAVNVEVESQNPYSFLENFKKLVELRTEGCVLYGPFVNLIVNINIYSFIRLMAGSKCLLVILNMNSNSVTVDFSTTMTTLPPVAYLEVTNPEYYDRTRSKYGQSLYEMGASSSSNVDPYENLIIVPLSEVTLEGKQCMVLSFEGRP